MPLKNPIKRKEYILAWRKTSRRKRGLLQRGGYNLLPIEERVGFKFPERIKARDIVNNAIKTGKLISQSCWVCYKKAEAHHPDYSTPLDVIWLCSLHHKAAHANIGT
jgi:hypothetical protein